MIIRKNLSLAGKFKFDVYTKDSELKYTTDYIDNFITPTGLNYAMVFGFADCFRYLTLGTGVAGNTATGNSIGTTGLHKPLGEFSYMGGNTTHSSCAEPKNRYYTQGCGYRIENSGVTLTRAWRVPESTDDFMTGDYTFKEYMLSPGRTGISGFFSFDGITGFACGCDEIVYPISGDGGTYTYGRESADFVAKFPSICSGGTKAFTRILKDIIVLTNEYLVVNYALTIGVTTGTTPFNIGVTRNSPVGDSFNWVRSSGASSIIHPGVKLINDGNVVSVGFMDQIPNYEFRLGESFYPPLGITLEPSCPDTSKIGYLSNDNLQFLVNSYSGGASGGAYLGQPSGLQYYHKNWVTETSNSTTSLGGLIDQLAYFYNPRSNVTKNFIDSYPSQTDITQATDYSTIAGGTFDPEIVEPDVVSQAFDTSLPFTGRTRGNVVSFSFKEPTRSTNYPVRAFVYGYNYLGYYLPAVDTLFYPTGGRLSPTVNFQSKTYPNPSGVISSIGGTGYNYFDGNNILQLQFRLTWSAPCPNGVSGCP